MPSFTAEQVADLNIGWHEAHAQYDELRNILAFRQFARERAAEHAKHGLLRRLGVMIRCIDRVFETIPPDLDEIPDRDKVHDATINIQSLLFNTFGCCDNLAWIWVLECDKRQADGSLFPPERIGLGPKYKNFRQTLVPELKAYLKSTDAWLAHIKDFRDALAHQIPLYIPPYCVDPKDAGKLEELEKASSNALLAGRLEAYQAFEERKTALTHFSPIMAHSLIDGPGTVIFHPQILADFATVHEMTKRFLDALP